MSCLEAAFRACLFTVCCRFYTYFFLPEALAAQGFKDVVLPDTANASVFQDFSKLGMLLCCCCFVAVAAVVVALL